MFIKSGLKKKIEGPLDVNRILVEILDAEPEIERSKEHFWVIGLSQRNVIEFIDLCHLGGLTAAVVDPRNIFRLALVQGVASIIIAHNHPSGNPTPSPEDNKTTENLSKAGNLLNIEVVDSLIIGDRKFFSYRDNQKNRKQEKEVKNIV